MNRSQKSEFVAGFSERLRNAPFVVLADPRGINVAEINEFRRALDKSGVHYEIVKNTLAKLAVEDTPMAGLSDLFTGMVGVVMSGEEGVAAAKALRDATKDFKKKGKFVLKGGFFDDELLDAEGIGKVADLPSRDELYAQLLALLLASPRNVLGVLQAPGRDLVGLLRNYEQKLTNQDS